MKKLSALILAFVMLLSLSACAQAEAPERTVAPYTYALENGGSGYAENLIFNADVVITGEEAQIVFSNCAFNSDIVLEAETGTKVMLFGCEVNGQCIIRNQVQEATIDYSFPKFLIDMPIPVMVEEGIGCVIVLGDFETLFNGQAYTMEESDLFSDATNLEAGLVPYTGQEASYYFVALCRENGQPYVQVGCEYDPGM